TEPPVPGKILPTFCLLSVTGSSRIAEDTITGNADKIDTSQRPWTSTAVRTTNSHGENRGSSPLGSASKFKYLRFRLLSAHCTSTKFVQRPIRSPALWSVKTCELVKRSAAVRARSLRLSKFSKRLRRPL